MTLPRNVGGIDRGLRIAAGSILLPLGLVMLAHDCPCGWVDVVVGALALGTGLSGFCVLYLPFRFSTARRRQAQGSGAPPRR